MQLSPYAVLAVGFLLIQCGHASDDTIGDRLGAAAVNGDVDALRDLLEHGANVDATDTDGDTALIAAAGGGHADCVQLLLEHGADVDATDTDGSTALIVAACGGHADCVKLLLEAGADPNHADRYGTPLMAIRNDGHTDCLKLLLEYKADVNAVDSSKCTPLMFAAHRGHARLVRLLLRAGATVGAVDEDGCTALTHCGYSIRNGIYATYEHDSIEDSIEVARLLIGEGANPDQFDDEGQSARTYAPDVMLSLEREQAQRVQDYRCLRVFFKGLIPRPKSGAGLAAFLLTDWEATALPGQPISDEDAADLEGIGAERARTPRLLSSA